MKIVLIPALCGVLLILNEAYGNTLPRLGGKVINGRKWVPTSSGRSHLVWVRVHEKEICTGFIVGRKAFMSTGDCALKIRTENHISVASRGFELEVYYKTFDYPRPFKINFVEYVELHPRYKYRDIERERKFSEYNFGLCFVRQIFNGNYAIEAIVPLYFQELSENENYLVVGWDSSIFDRKLSEIYGEPEVKEVTVVILGFRICQEMYYNTKGTFFLESFDGYLCVEIVDGSKLTKEDIGSPVILRSVVEGMIAYVPDPSLNLPALMIKRSKIGPKLHLPNDSCVYYDAKLKALTGIVDPADVELENFEPAEASHRGSHNPPSENDKKNA